MKKVIIPIIITYNKNYLKLIVDIKIRTYNMNYPTEHSATPIQQFIAKTFIIDGVRCFYPIDVNKKSSSKSDMTLEEFRMLQEGKPIMRTWNKGKENETTTEWRPVGASMTNIFEVNFANLNLFTTDIDDYQTNDEGKKVGAWDFAKTPEIFKNCPYTKSRTKGNPHFWYKIDGLDTEALKAGGFRNASKNLTFCNDGEILTNHSWEDKNGYVYNWNGEIPTIQWDELKKVMKPSEVKKWEKKANITDNTDSESSESSEVSNSMETLPIAEPPTNENIEKLALFKKLLPCYSIERLRGTGDFETGTWKRWTLAIVNTFGSSAIEDWDRVSKEKGGSTYSYAKNMEIWGQCLSMKQGKKKLGFASLIKWAKEDNLNLYNEICNPMNINWERLTHHSFALDLKERLLYESGSSSIVFTGKNKDMVGYLYNGVYWEELGLHNAEIKRKYFATMYEEYMEHFSRVAHHYDEVVQASIKNRILDLDNVNFRENVIKALQAECYIEKIEWNTKHHLFAFKDAIFDLDKGEFVEPNPKDYINYTCGYSYGKISKETLTKCKKDFDKYFETIFGNAELIAYIKKLLASFLRQENPEQKAYFWLGSGRNSKGTLTKFLQKALGRYFGELPLEFYTTQEKKQDAPNNQLVNNQFCRVHNTSEVGEDAYNVSKGQTFLSANFKRATGGDLITTRPLYAKKDETIEFRMGKQLIQTNIMPNIVGIELPENISLRERVVVIPFPYSFVDDDAQIARNPTKFKKRDDKVGEMLDNEEYKIAFITMLMENYATYKKEGLVQPKMVIDEKKKYFEGADLVKIWMDANLMEDTLNEKGEYGKKLDIRQEMFPAFNGEGSMKYTKFRSEIERLCGKRETRNGKGVFVRDGYYHLQGYKWKKDEDEDIEEE